MTDDLSVFELAEGGARKDPLATALSQVAAWQARAERLEGALRDLRKSAIVLSDDCMERDVGNRPDEYTVHAWSAGEWRQVKRAANVADAALSSPRPSPSRILEVVRRVLKWRILEDAMPRDREIPDDQLEEWSEVYGELLCCPGLFTPEERAAILGEGE